MTLREEIVDIHNQSFHARDALTGENQFGRGLRLESDAIWDALLRIAERIDESTPVVSAESSE